MIEVFFTTFSLVLATIAGVLAAGSLAFAGLLIAAALVERFFK